MQADTARKALRTGRHRHGWAVAAALAAVMLFAAPAASQIDYDYQPMVAAIEANNTIAVARFIDGGVRPNVVPKDRDPYMVVAARAGSLGVLKVLLARNGDPNAADRFGNTAMIWAADRGHIAIVRELLKHQAEIDDANRQGMTALMKAARAGRMAMVRLLLARGADPTVTDYTGATAVTWARRRNREAIARAIERAARK